MEVASWFSFVPGCFVFFGNKLNRARRLVVLFLTWKNLAGDNGWVESIFVLSEGCNVCRFINFLSYHR